MAATGLIDKEVKTTPGADPYAGLTTTNVAAPPPPAAPVQASAGQASTTTTTATTTGPAAQADATGYQGQGYDAAQTGPAAQATATTREVQANETIQGQLQGIIDSNSPLITRARARAKDEANARGLVNSTMAVQAGEAAAYDVALPIAQFDAGVYGQAARDNQSALTQVSMFNTGEKNKSEQFNVGETNKAAAFTADAKNTADRFSADAKNTASMFNAGETNKVAISNTQEVNRVNISNSEQANANARQNAQLITSTNIANAEAINKQQMQIYESSVQMAIQNADAANKQTLVKLDGVVKTGLAKIEAQYKNEMQASASASAMYQSAMQQATAIMTNPDIPGDKKGVYIDNILAMAGAGMDTAGALTNMDLGRYLDGLTIYGNGVAPKPVGETPAGAPQPTAANEQFNTTRNPNLDSENKGRKPGDFATDLMPGHQADGSYVNASGLWYPDYVMSVTSHNDPYINGSFMNPG